MDKINDGGAAFPLYDSNGDGKMFLAETGIYVRDYFAAKAMQGMLADSQTRQSCPEGQAEKWMRSFARVCYELADAMIAAREKQP